MFACIGLALSLFVHAAFADSSGACMDSSDQKTWADVKANISKTQLACILDGAPGAAWYDHCIRHFSNSSSDGEKCMTDCVEKRTHLSAACSGCFGEISRCTYEHCITSCIDASSTACIACGNKYCTPDFVQCSGITDLPHSASRLSGPDDIVFGVIAASVLSQSPSAVKTNNVSGIPDAVKKALHDFVCTALEEGAAKDEVVATICKKVHTKVRFVPEETCSKALKLLWEHEEVGLCKSTPVKAAELRRWEGNGKCIGNFSVLSTDNMNECTSYLIPAPASIWLEQKNETAYSSFHCQGVLDCSIDVRKLLGDFVVGTCDDLGGYSQMRVWVRAETVPMFVV